jgi:hypothetical protein
MDEDSSDGLLVFMLRQRGWDVVTTIERGWARTPDSALFVLAQRENRIIYTCNEVDYTRLAAAVSRAGEAHAGVIVRGPQNATAEQQFAALLEVADRYPHGFANLVTWATAF